MGKLGFRAARVYQTTSQRLEMKAMRDVPPWYNVVGSIPPGEILTRTQPVQHRPTKLKARTKKASRMFLPQPIVYEEDALRTQFYSHHPWELARPREIIETDGKDAARQDWRQLQQKDKPLDGESVVQRQLWLLNNVEGMTSVKAYDIARREFYQLRHEEEVERRIAHEEALATGAYFGKSRLEIGMIHEDAVFEEWRAWAIQKVETVESNRTAVSVNDDAGVVNAESEASPVPV